MSKVFHVDCGAVYEGDAATTITGLDYLEGETVAVLADGVSVGPKVVTNGEITLTTAATKVIVGLPYTTTVKTLPPDPGVVKKRALNPVLHFIDTGKGVKYGPDEDRLKDVPDLTEGELETVDIPVSIPGGYDTEGQIIVETSEPLPMFLASILYDVTGGD